MVNETQVGGKSRRKVAPLTPGDNVLVMGGTKSPYQFRVVVQKV